MKSNFVLAGLLLCVVACATGCTDTTAPAVAPVAIDTAPPAVPTGLWATATERTNVKLAWQPNAVDLDLAGYLVYRLAFGHAVLLTESPVTAARYLDTDPLDGPCIYAVTSIDLLGNESGWTQVRYNDGRVDTELDSATP